VLTTRATVMFSPTSTATYTHNTAQIIGTPYGPRNYFAQKGGHMHFRG